MNINEIGLRKIFSYHHWRHRVYLGHGYRTPGYNTLDHDWDFYGMPDSLKDKTVLDIGANDGYYSFGAEERGASAVTGIDIYGGDGKTMVGGWPIDGIIMLKEYLGSKVEIMSLSLFDLPKLDRKWDVVFCNDVLSWLDDIDKAITLVSNVANETVVIRDTFSTDPKAKKIPIRKMLDQCYMQRIGLSYLKKRLRELGFKSIRIKRIYSYRHYEWQYENFPSAESSGVIETYLSPFETVPSGNVIVNGQWILMEYGDFYYLRTLGWVKKQDVRIKPRLQRRMYLKEFKSIIPFRLLDWYYGYFSKEKKTHEYCIIARK